MYIPPPAMWEERRKSVMRDKRWSREGDASTVVYSGQVRMIGGNNFSVTNGSRREPQALSIKHNHFSRFRRNPRDD